MAGKDSNGAFERGWHHASFWDSQWRREKTEWILFPAWKQSICTCIINETSSRDSVRRVSGSWRFARTSNAAFEDSPATALLLVLHAHNNFHIHGFLLVSENKKQTMAGWEIRSRGSDKRERRGGGGGGGNGVCVCVCVCVGDCRHHHRHHRSVYKKNFFPTTFCVGDGNGTLSLSLCFYLCVVLLELKLPKHNNIKPHVQQSFSIFWSASFLHAFHRHSFINPLYPPPVGCILYS